MNLTSALRQRLLYWPAHNDLHSTGTSLAKTRLRTLALFTWGQRRTVHTRRRLKVLRELRDSTKGPAIILAGGPSAKLIRVEFVDWVQSLGGSVFAMNGFSQLDIASRVQPDYMVFADRLYFEPETRANYAIHAQVEADLQAANTARRAVFIPTNRSWHMDEGTKRIIHFNFDGLEGWSRNIDPTRPRGYSGMTAYAALALAIYMGCDPVYIAGIDSSYAKYVFLDDLNNVMLASHHAYSQPPRPWPIAGGMANFFGNLAQLSRDLDLFRPTAAVNLGGVESMIDAFPRACPWHPPSGSL